MPTLALLVKGGLLKTPSLPKEFENSFEDSVSDPRSWWKFSTCQMEAAKALDKACSKAQREFQGFIDNAGGIENLPRAALLRVDRIMMRPASTYLAALSIENQLKGCLIRQAPDLFKNEKAWKQFTTHSLVTLGEKVGLKLSKVERKQLDELTSVLTWSGRYPVAKNKEAGKWRWIAEAGAWGGPHLHRWKPLEEIEALRERLWMLYNATAKSARARAAVERRERQ